MKKKNTRRERKRVEASRLDLEAVGLVMLAAGAFLVGVLLPFLPSGELGRTVRAALTGPLGVGAYALPVPLIVLGALFLVRRNPRWWPRATLGYVLATAGVWGVLAAAAPAAAGAWGASLRAWLGGAWGVLAAVPAVVVGSVGIDLLAGWPPTRLLRVALGGLVTALKGLWRWLVQVRTTAKRRAGFQADVAQVRRGLTDLTRDLDALAELYPGSDEVGRWKDDVQASKARLSAATLPVLREVRADLGAWQGAVAGFAKDRAEELGAQLDFEAARAPLGDDGRTTTFEVWVATMKRLLGDGIGQRGRAADALDKLRQSLLLETTSLLERAKRLTRERDLERRAMKGMTPGQLANAQRSHHRRLASLRTVEAEAEGVDVVATLFEQWRPFIGEVHEALAEYPDSPVLADFHATLGAELEGKGRKLLGELGHVQDAFEAVVRRAELDRLEAERLAAEAARAEAAAAAAARAAVAAEAAGAGVRVEVGEAGGWEGGAGGAAARSGPSTAWRGGSHEEDEEPVGGDSDDQGIERVLIDGGEVPGTKREHGGERGERRLPARTVSAGVVGERTPAQTGTPSQSGTPAQTGTPAGRGVPAAGDLPEVGAIPITLPPIDLLDEPEAPPTDGRAAAQEHKARVRQIDDTLANFKLGGRVTAAVRGPSVTRFEVEPAPGEKISRFANLADDLALAMAVGSVRIEAPIPGKSVIGLEVPNAHRELVRFREAVETPSYRRAKARMPIVLGRSIDGEMMVGDLTRMPHLLIAGSTGSGKSVAVNTLVSSLLYRFLPTEMRFLMIDPKMVELTPYDGIPHLLRPVVTNPSDAAGVLLGAVSHMERRYKMMSKVGAKNLDQYNEKAKTLDLPPLPFIAIIIDELADLMITSPKEVESAIMRLAQMARATGMHLILATQRPSVDILTSLIKVNVPARMAFAVSSSHDSRTILDSMGAERLIGMGDMLYYQPGLVKAVRLQGPFVSENEIGRLADFLRRQYFDDDFVEAYGADFDPPPADESTASGLIDWNDDKLRAAAELVINEKQASVSRLQRRLSVGHARAGKLMDSLEALGVVGPHQGSKPRDVLVDLAELPNIFGK
ncbi:MAG: hypothetical protein KF875_09660 [Trueperaceae bacterium]|nr:hypothetical protein [Trueperaceae bacterium]MCO5174763.1 DNA translocase FtsK [Trueperaceae bacterium]